MFSRRLCRAFSGLACALHSVRRAFSAVCFKYGNIILCVVLYHCFFVFVIGPLSFLHRLLDIGHGPSNLIWQRIVFTGWGA